MQYEIYLSDGTYVNTISADESFIIAYCDRHTYLFQQVPEPEPTSIEERVDALEEENEILKDKLNAAIEKNSELEDCILEMGQTVYA